MDFGRFSRNSINFGTLYEASDFWQCHWIYSDVARAPGLRTTHALTASTW